MAFEEPTEAFDMTDPARQGEFFKRFYGPLSENLFNSMNVLHGRIRRDFNNFVGDEYRPANRLSFQGGYGAGELPVAGGKVIRQAVVTSRDVYQRIRIPRKAIKASMTNRGSFVRVTKEYMRGATETYARQCSRVLYGDGTGILGYGDGSTNVKAVTQAQKNAGIDADFVVRMGDERGIRRPGWIEANFEEEDIVQVVTGITVATGQGGTAEGGDTTANLLRIAKVDPDTRDIYLKGTSPVLTAHEGSSVFPATSALVPQRSYMKEPVGLRGTVELEKGTLYGIPYGRRWSGLLEDGLGRTITIPAIRRLVLDQDKRFGKVGKLIMTSYSQYNNLLEILGEDQKRYNINARTMKDKKLQAKTSFTGISLMTEAGEVGIFFDRFCPPDRLYIINDNFITVPTRPGHGWFDDDGRVLLREPNSDSYEARYGGYWNNYIVPTAHACLHNLAV